MDTEQSSTFVGQLLGFCISLEHCLHPNVRSDGVIHRAVQDFAIYSQILRPQASKEASGSASLPCFFRRSQ
jgi:hypothetical protein